jgi:hypothetical protein
VYGLGDTIELKSPCCVEAALAAGAGNTVRVVASAATSAVAASNRLQRANLNGATSND